MASESYVQVTEGSGKKLHTVQRTIGANTVEDECTVAAEQFLPTYTVLAGSIALTSANDHLVALMAGSSLNLYVHRIFIQQRNLAAAANQAALELVRLTTNGSGGSSVTPRPLDTTAAAAGASARTLDTAKGTEGVSLYRLNFGLVAAQPVSASDCSILWDAHPLGQSIRIPAGTANGIAVKNLVAISSATVNVVIEFREANY